MACLIPAEADEVRALALCSPPSRRGQTGEVAVATRPVTQCPEERATEEIVEAARLAIVIGAHRTPLQDPDFSIRHLVEIAVRALSPGINDPYTAIELA
jgi:uncharacterized membrane protein